MKKFIKITIVFKNNIKLKLVIGNPVYNYGVANFNNSEYEFYYTINKTYRIRKSEILYIIEKD